MGTWRNSWKCSPATVWSAWRSSAWNWYCSTLRSPACCHTRQINQTMIPNQSNDGKPHMDNISDKTWRYGNHTRGVIDLSFKPLFRPVGAWCNYGVPKKLYIQHILRGINKLFPAETDCGSSRTFLLRIILNIAALLIRIHSMPALYLRGPLDTPWSTLLFVNL